MTCIAWDGKVLAGDRRTVTRIGTLGKTTKVFKIENRERGILLVGASGSFQDCVAVIEWLKGGARPDNVDGVSVLIIDAKKNVYEMEDRLVFMPLLRGRRAIGSGRQAAMAAMLLGAGAKGAIRIASKIVCDVGDGVDTVSF